MNRQIKIFGKDFLIPAASMSLFNTLAIIALIPIYDKIVVPFLKRVNMNPSNLQRIGWGKLSYILQYLLNILYK